jgi:hypothetical protein
MDWADILKTLITAVASVVVALVTAGYFRKNQDKNKEKKSREKLMVQIQRDELIHFTLKELRRKYVTDRVYIIQFHNGGTFYTQSPMQKASVTYERCSDGLERISDRFQNVLVSNYNWYLTETIANRLFYVDVDSQIGDLPTKSLLKHYGNYAHAGVPIYDSNKYLVAVLCMSWVFSEFPTTISNEGNFTEEFKSQLYEDANSLKPYLL